MKVELTYFKESGKYYGEGQYETNRKELWDIWDEIEEMLKAGRRPGLIDGHSGFHVLIDVPEHCHNHPHLFPGIA